MNGQQPPPSPSWQDEARLATLLTWLAAAIALFVATSGPIAYFWLSFEGESKECALAARLHATFVTQAISVGEDDWRPQVAGLLDAELSPSLLPETRSIRDGSGWSVSSGDQRLAGPLLSRSAPLFRQEGTVGEVVISRSLLPLVNETLIVAVLGALLGLAIYASLRVLPLRLLRRTLAALRQRETQAREEAEEQLRVIFENASEGIVLFAEDGSIVSCNPAAVRMFGYPPEALAGMPLERLLQLPAGDGAPPFALQPCETLALRRDAGTFPVDLSFNRSHAGGELRHIAIIRDITERKEVEARLSYLANFDSLTGLPNRTLFRDRLAQAMERARRSGQPLALMFLDLDRFKTINDSLGHDAGDELLKQVADSLGHCLRRTDSLAFAGSTVSRLGGDEFTILAEIRQVPADAAHIAERVLAALRNPFQIRDHEVYISTSVGIVIYPKDGTDLDGLLKQADVAMYRAKELGRNTYQFYTDDLDAQAAERMTLEASLRHAQSRGEFTLHYQPKADLESGAVTGVEALLRWHRPGQPTIGPDKFVPILEETGLILAVGTWLMRHACEQMMEWRSQGLPALKLAVNLSALQLRQPDLGERIAAIIAETGINPASLEIELTESMLMDDSATSLRVLSSLSAMGIGLAIDDFGTGHSSLSYLKRFNVDTLKIDRSFVRNIPDIQEDNAIASAVVALAKSLNLQVVAEGVETAAQADFLRQLRCDQMQGYLLSRPLPADALPAWLHQRPALPPARPH